MTEEIFFKTRTAKTGRGGVRLILLLPQEVTQFMNIKEKEIFNLYPNKTTGELVFRKPAVEESNEPH